MDADLVNSALMRIARSMNSLAKSLKRVVTKVQLKHTETNPICKIDFTEELTHTEINPMCSIHSSRVPSC